MEPTLGVRDRWWVLVAVGVGTFMAALDGSVVNTILPVLSRTFQRGVSRVEWVTAIYLLVVSGLMLGFGRLGDMRGQKPLYMLGFVAFIIGSAACGAAPTLSSLVVFRGMQALGAAMIAANSPAILTKSFPAAQRGRALGLQATMTYMGLTVGPSLGGWLTDRWSWRSVFYINVPVGLLALLLADRFIPSDRPRETAPPFDWPGGAAFLVGLTALLLALDQGNAWGWTSPLTLGVGLVGLALLASFWHIERRAQAPMLDLRLFGNRTFSQATASAVLNYIGVYGLVFLLPFYLIQGRGLTPGEAGRLLTAQPLVMAIAAPLSGALSDRIGTRWPAAFGMVLMALGFGLLSRLGAASPLRDAAVGLAVVGLGTGVFISPNNSALMGSAPRSEQGIAGGILATARSVGMVLGVGLAGALFTSIAGQTGPIAPALPTMHAVAVGMRVLAGVSLLGALVSALRGAT